MAFDLDPSYKQVPERIADFKAVHPDGCLRPVDPTRPYWVETIDGKTFLVYAAAAYRTADDPMPGVGVAWEPFPGKTPYTRDSELQNAETSAWGRAIVAVLASESKSVASAEDVRNRKADSGTVDPPADKATHEQVRQTIAALSDGQRVEFAAWFKGEQLPSIKSTDRLTAAQADLVLAHLDGYPADDPGRPFEAA